MKNILWVGLLAALLLLAGCAPAAQPTDAPAVETTTLPTPAEEDAAQPPDPADTPDREPEAGAPAPTPETSQIGVEQNAGSVQITLPASLLGDTDAAEIIAAAAEEGVVVTVNDDGSAIFRMTPAQHRALLQELAEGIEETFALLLEDEDVTCYKAIEANADYTQLSITVDQEAFENDFFAQFYLLMIVVGPSYYQLFDGKGEDVQLRLDFYNEAGQLFDTQYYPE